MVAGEVRLEHRHKGFGLRDDRLSKTAQDTGSTQIEAASNPALRS